MKVPATNPALAPSLPSSAMKLGGIRGLIEKRKANTLKIEALTYYGFIPAETTILFFVADRRSYADNKSIFEEIRRRYETK